MEVILAPLKYRCGLHPAGTKVLQLVMFLPYPLLDLYELVLLRMHYHARSIALIESASMCLRDFSLYMVA